MIFFRTCCGCTTLRKGCIAIGAIELLGAFMSMGSRSSSLRIGASIIGVFISGLLIHGAKVGNRLYLWPWIVENIIRTIAIGIGFIICVLAPDTAYGFISAYGGPNLTEKYTDEASVVQMFTLALLFVAFIQIWLILIVYSHVCELREEEERSRMTSAKIYVVAPV